MTLRWLALPALALTLHVAPAHADTTAPELGEQLASYYGKANNYRRVKRDVLRWHKTTRNGCVAFASTALRHLGVTIPQDLKRGGFGVSRITFAFSAYLEEKGWSRSDDFAELSAGDLVFTTGFPDHVFVFHSWSDTKKQRVKAIDNTGRMHSRSLFPREGHAHSPFAYFLRSPEPTTPRVSP
jgi:hypothetical protein